MQILFDLRPISGTGALSVDGGFCQNALQCSHLFSLMGLIWRPVLSDDSNKE